MPRESLSLSAAAARWLDALRGDLRQAGRGLRRDARFSLVAVLILGTALGANAALFAFLSGYFLKPLPIARATDHVELEAREVGGGARSSWGLVEVDALRAATAGVLEHGYGAAERRAVTLPLDGREPVIAHGAIVSDEYFALVVPRLSLGRIPWLAGAAAPGEPGTGGAPAVVLSDAGWRRLAAGRADVLGQALRIDGVFFTVAGVMAPAVGGLEPVVPDFWAQAGGYERAVSAPGARRLRYRVGGLVREGVEPAVLAQALDAAVAALPPTSGPAGGLASGLARRRPTLLRERSELAPVAAMLLAAFALLTAVACANLSGMQLARGAGRTRDLAVRFALGASRARVVRQLLGESLALAGLGALAGCLFAAGTVATVHRHVFSLVVASGLTLPPVEVDWRVALYVLGLAAAMAGVCVVLPALAAVALQPDARAALAGGPLRGERRPHRALDLLVVGQAATSVALLVAAGTVVENAGRARRAEPGYALAPLVDLAFEHPSPQLVERLLADPRVESATTVAQTPLAGQAARIDVEVEGRRQRLAHNLVDHRFFAVTGIPIRRGRGFLPGDGAPEVRRAVVSESAAGRLWPGADPVGETIDVDEDGGEAAPARYEVVGVAADALSGWFFEGREVPMVYLAAPVASPLTAETIVRRRGGEAGALAGLRALCQAHDPAATCTPTPLQSLLDRQRVPFVVAAQVASALGLTSLALACLGLYGLVGFLVVRQTREIGVRMALGATRRGVLLGVLGAAARRMALGTALGLPVCLAALALLESRLTLLDTFHPGVFVLAPAALVAAGVVAALLPARRAASVDPLVALRHD